MKYILMHETVTAHDAVGNDIEAMYRILQQEGECYIYACNCRNKNVQYIDEDRLRSYACEPDTLIIYHHSVCWEQGYQLIRQAKCRVVFRYHNITPAGFFRLYSQPHYDVCSKGYEQTLELQRQFPDSYWICDSEYNARDLCQVKKDHILIVPPFNKLEEWGTAQPDAAVTQTLEREPGLKLLFVGRVVPNKGHIFLLDVLRKYKQQYGGRVRLRIIGKTEEVMKPYTDVVARYIHKFGLENDIEFIGEVTDETLTAYYRSSDIMVCGSFHEGFCVPIVEAQYFGLPIVALRYCAVPETLGENQLTVGYDAAEMATAIHTLAAHEEYRERLAAAGRKNYENRFTHAAIAERFHRALDTVLGQSETAGQHAAAQKEAGQLRIALVTPWYGENITGGAEMECRQVARHLLAAGVNVEILSTCAKQFAGDWGTDYYPEGVEYIDRLLVARFHLDERDTAAFDRVNAKLMQQKPISADEEETFCREMVNSADLYRYIRNAHDAYDAFVFIPYMFGTTYYGVQECYDRAVLLPCFHDESYAYMKNFRRVFSKVRGIVYNAAPEQELANRLYDLQQTEQIVMGIGMDTDITYDSDRFRSKFGIGEEFILYAGRKDPGKGVDDLIAYFCDYKKKNACGLKLVLIGGGSIDIPAEYADDIIDLGFVDRQDKYDACGAALCLCQLSQHESFSFVIMESWLCDRPVIVHEKCAVTADFARRFDGGCSIANGEEFAAALDLYRKHPEEAAEKGRNGHQCVADHFAWDTITEKYIGFFNRIAEK